MSELYIRQFHTGMKKILCSSKYKMKSRDKFQEPIAPSRGKIKFIKLSSKRYALQEPEDFQEKSS